MNALWGDDKSAQVLEHERDRGLVAMGYTNMCYCLVLNTQLQFEHEAFLARQKRHPKPTRTFAVNRRLAKDYRTGPRDEQTREVRGVIRLPLVTGMSTGSGCGCHALTWENLNGPCMYVLR